MRVALRVEVNTLSGALEGVPTLLELFDQHQVKASFLLSLGPDYSTLVIKPLIPESLLRWVPVHYISHRARDALLAIADAGHEIGITAYTASDWQEDVAYREAEWVESEVAQAVKHFQELFSYAPAFYGATGWQINAHLLAAEDKYGFKFASDVRGQHAFYPELQGICSRVTQLPTTLPSLEELLNQSDVTLDNLHEHLFALSQRVLPNGEVFSICADRDGLYLTAQLERLLTMWKAGGWEINTLGQLYQSIKGAKLQRHLIGWDKLPGQERYLAMQSVESDMKNH